MYALVNKLYGIRCLVYYSALYNWHALGLRANCPRIVVSQVLKVCSISPTVDFRVVGVTPTLKPVYGTMTIYILDAGRNVVERWLSQQLNMGKLFHSLGTVNRSFRDDGHDENMICFMACIFLWTFKRKVSQGKESGRLGIKIV